MTNRQWTDEDAFAAVREACRYLGYDPADNEPDYSVDERLNGTGSDRHFALRDVGLRILTLEARLAATDEARGILDREAKHWMEEYHASQDRLAEVTRESSANATLADLLKAERDQECERAEAAGQQVARLLDGFERAAKACDSYVGDSDGSAFQDGASLARAKCAETIRDIAAALAATDPDQRLSASDMSCTGCYSRPCICDELANREGA